MYSYKHIQNFAPEMPQIIDVFYDSFAASEGIDEGDLIQSIVKNLLGNTANSDLFVFGAIYNNSIIGCAIFSFYRPWPFTPIIKTMVSDKTCCWKV